MQRTPSAGHGMRAQQQEAALAELERHPIGRPCGLLAREPRSAGRGSLRDDVDAVLAVAARDSMALVDAAPALWADRRFALAAVHIHGWALGFCSHQLRATKSIVLAAVLTDGGAIKHAASAMCADKEVALVAVAQDPSSLNYVAEALRRDTSVRQLAILEDRTLVQEMLRLRLYSFLEYCPKMAAHRVTPAMLPSLSSAELRSLGMASSAKRAAFLAAVGPGQPGPGLGLGLGPQPEPEPQLQPEPQPEPEPNLPAPILSKAGEEVLPTAPGSCALGDVPAAAAPQRGRDFNARKRRKSLEHDEDGLKAMQAASQAAAMAATAAATRSKVPEPEPEPEPELELEPEPEGNDGDGIPSTPPASRLLTAIARKSGEKGRRSVRSRSSSTAPTIEASDGEPSEIVSGADDDGLLPAGLMVEQARPASVKARSAMRKLRVVQRLSGAAGLAALAGDSATSAPAHAAAVVALPEQIRDANGRVHERRKTDLEHDDAAAEAAAAHSATLDDMPEGLSTVEQLKWKKANGLVKSKPAGDAAAKRRRGSVFVAGGPAPPPGLTKIEQIKWKKKQDRQNANESQTAASGEPQAATTDSPPNLDVLAEEPEPNGDEPPPGMTPSEHINQSMDPGSAAARIARSQALLARLEGMAVGGYGGGYGGGYCTVVAATVAVPTVMGTAVLVASPAPAPALAPATSARPTSSPAAAGGAGGAAGGQSPMSKLETLKAEARRKRVGSAKKAKEAEAAAAATGGATTPGGSGSSENGEGPTMPEGLSAKERMKWKREHRDYVGSSTGKGGKAKPKLTAKSSVVSSVEQDKDMPEEIRNSSKLDQMKWRKKQAALADRDSAG